MHLSVVGRWAGLRTRIKGHASLVLGLLESQERGNSVQEKFSESKARWIGVRSVVAG